jgi:hypothetical protein
VAYGVDTSDSCGVQSFYESWIVQLL